MSSDDACATETLLQHFKACVDPLVAAAKNVRDVEYAQFEPLLERSRELLAPFGEPLEQDFGLVGALEGAREELYSNWFAWLFRQLTADELADVLGPALHGSGFVRSPERIETVREHPVKHGHDGKAGRLDLLLEIGRGTIVVIEVKLGDADDSDYVKNIGYTNSIAQAYPHKESFRVFLVKNATKTSYNNFVVCNYSTLCRNLRRLVRDRQSRTNFAVSPQDANGQLVSASILMLVGAIEVNILKLVVTRNHLDTKTRNHIALFVEGPCYERA